MADLLARKPEFSERDGRELAVAMLHDLEDIDCGLTAIEAEYRHEGAPQLNVVVRYLATLRERNSSELDAGFGAILTDFLSTVLGGCVPEVSFYEDLIADDQCRA